MKDYHELPGGSPVEYTADRLPQLRRYVVRPASNDLLQLLVGAAALHDGLGSGRDGRRAAHPRAAMDKRGDFVLQQRHKRLNRRAKHARLVLAPSYTGK